jgi:hypothetical protein
MQDNGVNRVFFQNKGCIFNAGKAPAAPGLIDGLLMVGGPGQTGVAQIKYPALTQS